MLRCGRIYQLEQLLNPALLYSLFPFPVFLFILLHTDNLEIR